MPKHKYNPAEPRFPNIPQTDYMVSKAEIGRSLLKGVLKGGTVGGAVGIAIGTALFHSPLDSEKDKGPAYNACDIRNTQVVDADLEELARNCLDERYGRVALVGFNIPSFDLTISANESEKLIADGTGGLIRPEIVPMSASDEALQKFEKTTGNLSKIPKRSVPCADQDNPENDASAIADRVMDLGEYDRVIAVVDVPRCDEEAAGDASGRYGRVYNVRSVFKRGPHEVRYYDDAADVVAHEVGHTYEWDHADALDFSYFARSSDALDGHTGWFDKLIDHNLTNENLNTYDLTPPSRLLTHQEFLDCQAGQNVMGDHEGGKLTPLSWQKWQAQWPERELGQIPDRQIVLNWATSFIEHPISQDHDFAVLMLEKPVTFRYRDWKGDINEKMYDKLVFDPSGDDLNMVQIYYAEKDGNETLGIAYIGVSSRIEDPLTIVVGNQKIELRAIGTEGIEYRDVTVQSAIK